MILGSKYGQSAWYIRNTSSTPDESLRPKSTMERLTFSLSGSALGMDFQSWILYPIDPLIVSLRLADYQSEGRQENPLKLNL